MATTVECNGEIIKAFKQKIIYSRSGARDEPKTKPQMAIFLRCVSIRHKSDRASIRLFRGAEKFEKNIGLRLNQNSQKGSDLEIASRSVTAAWYLIRSVS